LHSSLLEILAEPITGAPLTLRDAVVEDGLIQEGTLHAPGGKSYPIVRGIPRFVESDNYTKSFGEQWNRFREVQLDSLNHCHRSERRFDNETHWTADNLRGRWTLDAGCGAGRFAEIAAKRGAKLVALDMSSAVEATAATLHAQPGAHVDVVQASLLEPPFKPGVFDYAYSLGVIQHTPDPKRGVREVVRCVRPGGGFAFAIYARQPWTKLNAKYLLRPLTRRMPQDKLLGAIEKVMPVAFPVTDKLFRIPVAGKLFRFTIPIANYVDNTEFTREQRYSEAVLDTFDMLAPWYDSPMTFEEVEHELRALGAAKWTFRSRVPVVVSGVR
jgi:2-polyprenyl-3-methyl-5-hydroxy-6-metoxy-1,4-benzoquinol methylase